jgi:hypothetical protein
MIKFAKMVRLTKHRPRTSICEHPLKNIFKICNIRDNLIGAACKGGTKLAQLAKKG